MTMLLGKKIGMTQVYDDNGGVVPVTVIQAGPCMVLQVKTPERDGYAALQLGFDDVKPSRRKIRIRYKPGDTRASNRSIAEDLNNCHALVTHDSNIAVEAILAGVPVFVTGTSPAQVFGNVDVLTIREPRRDVDRWEWLSILANNQWTLNEIQDGMANETLTKHKVRYENRRS